jgi:hypothetical protein
LIENSMMALSKSFFPLAQLTWKTIKNLAGTANWFFVLKLVSVCVKKLSGTGNGKLYHDGKHQ